MSADESIQMLDQLLWKAVVITAPLLLALLLVGVFVSVLQVITQVQEMSLTFIPKLITAVMVLATTGPWMLRQLVGYSVALINEIPSKL